MHRLLHLISLSCLLTGSLAQFGVAGGRRKQGGSSFQDLNEMAKQAQAGGEGAAAAGAGGDAAVRLQDLLAGAGGGGGMADLMGNMQEQLGAVYEQMAQMSPEELQKQMQDAMQMLTSGDMVENIVNKKDEVLASLEQSGMVSAEELEKYKKDPAYFEEQMRGAFDQMAGMFNNPEMINTMTQTMSAITDPAMLEFNKLLEEGLTDDVKLEEARLQLLSNPSLAKNPLFEAIFEDEDFQKVVGDPQKWQDAFKEGQEAIKQATAGLTGFGGGGGAGVKTEL
jgi:hypothetical protein